MPRKNPCQLSSVCWRIFPQLHPSRCASSMLCNSNTRWPMTLSTRCSEFQIAELEMSQARVSTLNAMQTGSLFVQPLISGKISKKSLAVSIVQSTTRCSQKLFRCSGQKQSRCVRLWGSFTVPMPMRPRLLLNGRFRLSLTQAPEVW